MRSQIFRVGIIFCCFFMAACQKATPAMPAVDETVSMTTQIGTSTSSAVTPTELPPPLPAAAVVNNERILLSDYEEELLRYQDAVLESGKTFDEVTAHAIVLENLIDLTLLAQAARENGQSITAEVYNQRLENLVAQLGGQEKLQGWMTTNHYHQESFERFYRLEIEAAKTREKIVNSVPRSVEQVHARQIMVQSKTRADEIFAQLQAGADFATLCWIYDPLTGGELSWFPRNYLVIPEIEDAVFALQPGEFTNVISTDYGYQIVQVIEKESQRNLTQDALLTYQRKALTDWIQTAKSSAQIELLVQ